MRWTRGLLVVGAVALGFGVPARPVPPPAPGRRLGSVPLDPSLPDLLRDHLDVDGDGLVPETNSVVLCARATCPRNGRLSAAPPTPFRKARLGIMAGRLHRPELGRNESCRCC